MGRNQNVKRVAQVYRAVQQRPGQRPSVVAQALGINRSEVTRILPVLEEYGYRLTEDDQGRLWPYQEEDR